MASLLGLLLMLIILGVMGAIAVSALDGQSSSVLGPATTLPGGGAASNAPSAAALQAACVADYQTLDVALQVYATLHGSNPPAGTAWVAGVPSGTKIVESWPSAPGHFRLTWNGSQLGVVPEHGTSSRGSAGTSQPPTGCDATLS